MKWGKIENGIKYGTEREKMQGKDEDSEQVDRKEGGVTQENKEKRRIEEKKENRNGRKQEACENSKRMN